MFCKRKAKIHSLSEIRDSLRKNRFKEWKCYSKQKHNSDTLYLYIVVHDYDVTPKQSKK